ncbi:hypothetical protein F4804DRAFT_315435 [Jackrogersella minutella]|nr:hypothetical protein F4804DRAFT_315435 [Jackrogersella minutella]
MIACGTCWTEFQSLEGRQQHLDEWCHSIPQYECDVCTAYFQSRSAVVNHMEAKNHWFFECDLCGKSYPTEEERKKHEIEDHHYCSPCRHRFISYNNVKMHLNSGIHRGHNIQCPFCKRHYVSATGLLHHLENGACPMAPSLDRNGVYEIVRRKDPSGIISNNLLGWNSAPRYLATALAWNGIAYECYLCHHKFEKLESLNQHLASPKHQQKLYHCPKGLTCGREFTTLAALMNHLESESCRYTRFENVQKNAKNILSSDRLISFK